jgi:hypothetical protein
MLIAISALFSAGGVLAQQIDARVLLEEMSAEIAGLESFIVQGDAYADARLVAGQIIEHSSQVTLRLRREPGAVRVTNRSAEGTKEVFFDDGRLTVYTSDKNYYAQTEIPKGVDSMLEFAVDQVGVEVPLLDFISANIADDMLADADEVSYLEKSLIRDKLYHHIGIRSSEVDVQIWVATEGRPLPSKLVITSKWEGGAPRFVAFFEWDTTPTFSDDLFEFEPPEGAIEIDFLSDVQR